MVESVSGHLRPQSTRHRASGLTIRCRTIGRRCNAHRCGCALTCGQFGNGCGHKAHIEWRRTCAQDKRSGIRSDVGDGDRGFERLGARGSPERAGAECERGARVACRGGSRNRGTHAPYRGKRAGLKAQVRIEPVEQ